MPILFLICLNLFFTWPSFARQQSEHVSAELVSEMGSSAPGQEAWVGVRMLVEEHWHIYWKMPGDSGLPTKVKWSLPPGWTISDPAWPIPERILLLPLVNYGYENEALIGFRLKIPKEEKIGKKEISASLSWLVCKEECIPGKAELSIAINVSNENPKRNPWAGAFDALRDQQPRAVPSGEAFMLSHDEESFSLQITNHSKWLGKRLDFFPYSEDMILGQEAPRLTQIANSSFDLQIKKSPAFALGKRFQGMLVVEGAKAYEMDLSIPKISPAKIYHAGTQAEEEPLFLSVLFALIGGLILNLMPCVFPVLGMKAISLINLSGRARAEAKILGLAYTAGILVSFLVLAFLLLMLRSIGVAAGWGFQLQSPGFVFGLVFLFTLMAWNLLGVFEIGGSWLGIGAALAGREGALGSFFTGILAVVVASPCTAPFMGAAVAAVIGASLGKIVAVFLALGLGLALPFLLLSFMPGLQRCLPRPGSWMNWFKQIMALPLLLTCVWLLWVLKQQVGFFGLILASSAILTMSIGVGIRHYFRRFSWSVYLMIASFFLAGALGIAASREKIVQLKEASQGSWAAFDESLLAKALEEGRPVFIDFTAAWCISCQVNKKTVLESAEMEKFFREKNILLLKADFTNQDPVIAKALASYQSVSVPLYVFYRSGSSQPGRLNTILTKETVKQAFE